MKQSRILHSILLIMESVLFGMFVIAIACDQFEAIFSDETLVEQAKKQVGAQYTDETGDHVIPVLFVAAGSVPAAAAPRGAAGGGVRARPPGDLAAALPHLRHQGLGAPAELRCVGIATLRPLTLT